MNIKKESFGRLAHRLCAVSGLMLFLSGCCSTVNCDWEYTSLNGEPARASAGSCSSGCRPTQADWQQIDPALGP